MTKKRVDAHCIVMSSTNGSDEVMMIHCLLNFVPHVVNIRSRCVVTRMALTVARVKLGKAQRSNETSVDENTRRTTNRGVRVMSTMHFNRCCL
jgi:hypothetical protein